MTENNITPNADSIISIAKTGSISGVLWLLEMEINGKNVIELSKENQKEIIKSAIYSRNPRLVKMLVSRFNFLVTNELIVPAIFSSNPHLLRLLKELSSNDGNSSLRIDKFMSFSPIGIGEHSNLDIWINGWSCVRYLFNPFNNIEWNQSLVFLVDCPSYRLVAQFANLLKQNPNNSTKIGFNSNEFSSEFPYSYDCPMVCYDWVDFLFVHHNRMEKNDLTILLKTDWIQNTPSPIGRHYLALFAEQGLVDLPKETIEFLKTSSAAMLKQNPKLVELIYPARKEETESRLRLK